MPQVIRAITADCVTVVDPTDQSRANSVRLTPRRLVRRMSLARPMCGDTPQSGPGERSNLLSRSMVCRWNGWHGSRIYTPTYTATVTGGLRPKPSVTLACGSIIARRAFGVSPHLPGLPRDAPIRPTP